MAFTKQNISELKEYKFKPYLLKQHVPKSGLVPRGRSGHRIVSDNSFIYSFGGFNPLLEEDERTVSGSADDMKLFRELWRFNIATGRWNKLDHLSSSLPKQLASNAVILAGNLLIVHGGTGFPFGYINSNKTYIADLKRNTSLKLIQTRGSLPNAQYGQAMIIIDHDLYVVGGTTGYEYSADVHRLNLKTKVWDEVYVSKGLSHLEPKGRFRHEIAFYESKIIIFGGGTEEKAFEFEHLPAFNIKTQEWEVLTTIADSKRDGTIGDPCFPAPRRCHGSVQVPGDNYGDSEFIICGGFNGVKIFSDMWKLNLRTLKWTKCGDMLYPLYFHSSSLSPSGQMFIFGGISEILNNHGSFTIRTNEVFSTWVTIPKLSEICWDAILYYCSNLCCYSKSKLLNCGVPKEFVERIHF